MKKLSFETIQNEFSKRGCRLISSEYVNEYEKLEYIASCGHTHHISWNNFQRGKGTICSSCAGGTKYSIDEVRDILKSNGCVLLSNVYINNKKRLKYIGKCGHVCSGTLTGIIMGIGLLCEKCRKSPSYTLEDVQKYFSDNGCKLLDTKYLNGKVQLNYIATCGHKNKISFNKFKNGNQGRLCKKCVGHERNTLDKISTVLHGRGCRLLADTDYKNCRSLIHYIAKCGHENTCSYINFLGGKGTVCKRCATKFQCEDICFELLKQKFGDALVRHYYVRFDDVHYGYFDFYIEDKKLAIEYNGVQHYRFDPFFHRDEAGFNCQLFRDQMKRDYCKKRGIKLIEIDGREWTLNKILRDDFSSFLNCVL